MTAKRLTHRQELALNALLDGQTVTAAAQAAGVSPRTAFRWLQDECFSGRLRESQMLALNQAMHELQGAAGRAVSALIKNLDDKNGFVSNGAAVAILTHGMRAKELIDLAERVSRLEN